MYLDRSLRDTPIAILDFETTGLSPKAGARVVEIAVVRVDPGRSPEVVLDTLIDPQGPVHCTSIHGINDDDVLGAPDFSEVLGDLVKSLDGAIVGAFNASFDMSFVRAECGLSRHGRALRTPPHVCLMWLRPLLGLSPRCSLDAACAHHGLPAGTHRAVDDALACARMWTHYVEAAERRGVSTIRELAGAGSHRYLSTLNDEPYSSADFQLLHGWVRGTALKPRLQSMRSEEARPQKKRSDRNGAQRIYWHELIDALSDGTLCSQETARLLKRQQELALAEDDIRSVHARLLANRLAEYAEDGALDVAEAGAVDTLVTALHTLGWAPKLVPC